MHAAAPTVSNGSDATPPVERPEDDLSAGTEPGDDGAHLAPADLAPRITGQPPEADAADPVPVAARPVGAGERGPLSAPEGSGDSIPLLDHPSAGVRASAVARVEVSPSNVAILHGLLENDLAVGVRAGAVRALAHASEADQRSALSVALADPSAMVRTAAVEALATTGPFPLELLVTACDDSDAGVRRSAYNRLAAATVPVVWKTMSGSPYRQARRVELGDLAPEQLADRAEESMRSAVAEDRVFALELAAEAGTPAAMAMVTAAVADDDATVRRSAVAQLRGRLDAAEVIVGALRDSEASVRLEAARTLDSLDHDGALMGLVASLGDPDPAVQRTCIEVLVSRSSAGLARRVAAALTFSNAGAVEEVLLRMGPAGQRALADRIRQDALAEATAPKQWSSRRALAATARARRRASSEPSVDQAGGA